MITVFKITEVIFYQNEDFAILCLVTKLWFPVVLIQFYEI